MPTTIFTDRCSTEIHPLKFGGTDQEMIKKAAIKTKGRSGPSALEADRSWTIVCSKNFADINMNLSKSNSKFYQGALHRKKCKLFLLKHFLLADSFLLIQTRVSDSGWGNPWQNHGKSHCVSTEERSCFIIRLDPEQLYILWRKFLIRIYRSIILVNAANAFSSNSRKVFLHYISILCPAISQHQLGCL